jgi:hypothetical protein
METQDQLKAALEEVEFYKLELDRERKAYENVYGHPFTTCTWEEINRKASLLLKVLLAER